MDAKTIIAFKKIKVLSVGSLGRRNKISPFRLEQGESLKKLGIEIDYFNIKGQGFLGYLRNLPTLRKKIKEKSYDLIHAHYGLSGLLSVLQRRVPIVITFHGSDIWNFKIRPLCILASYLSVWNIFISKALKSKAKGLRKKSSSIIPCGVDLKKFLPMDKKKAREQLGMKEEKKYVLFSSSFSNKIKNYTLAKEAMKYIPHAKLVELKRYNKKEVNLLMNACDLLLVTSFHESGPLVVKEAMACGCPIVSTDVGDVKWVTGDTHVCYITSFDPEEIASKIKLALEFSKKHGQTEGRQRIIELGLDLETIATRIIRVHESVLEKSVLKKKDER